MKRRIKIDWKLATVFSNVAKNIQVKCHAFSIILSVAVSFFIYHFTSRTFFIYVLFIFSLQVLDAAYVHFLPFLPRYFQIGYTVCASLYFEEIGPVQPVRTYMHTSIFFTLMLSHLFSDFSPPFLISNAYGNTQNHNTVTPWSHFFYHTFFLLLYLTFIIYSVRRLAEFIICILTWRIFLHL